MLITLAEQAAAGGAAGGLFSIESLVAFLTLASLEIVLGIDNIVFIAILTGRLPKEKQGRVRQIGLLLAMGMRIGLLLGISWVMGLTKTLFTVLEHAITGKDLVLIVGGLFLVGKATYEVHHRLEEHEAPGDPTSPARSKLHSVSAILFQIVLLDIVFSLDSVITAVGMAKQIEIMIAAVVAAVLVMMLFAGKISRFIEHHPTLKMLALAFLLLIGVMLVADGLHHHIPKGYIYFAMAFSLGVEILNIRASKKRKHTSHDASAASA